MQNNFIFTICTLDGNKCSKNSCIGDVTHANLQPLACLSEVKVVRINIPCVNLGVMGISLNPFLSVSLKASLKTKH